MAIWSEYWTELHHRNRLHFRNYTHWRHQESEVGGKVVGVPPAGSRGRAPLAAWVQSTQKPKTWHILRLESRSWMHTVAFIPHNIITFVIGFSRNSHISDFQSLPQSSPTSPLPSLCVHTSHRICANHRIKSMSSWDGAAALFPPWRR